MSLRVWALSLSQVCYILKTTQASKAEVGLSAQQLLNSYFVLGISPRASHKLSHCPTTI